MPERVPDQLVALVRERGKNLLRYAYQLTRDAEVAADVVQEALTLVLDTDTKRPLVISNCEAYVRRCILNTYISRGRLRSSQELVSGDFNESIASSSDSTAEVAQKISIWEMVGRLPLRQRAAIVLRFHQDLSFRDIAYELGCEESTARSLTTRALNAI